MQRHFKLYVPKEPVHPALALRKRLLWLLPGLTEYSAVGAWRDDTLRLHQEGVFVFEFVLDSMSDDVLDRIKQYKEEAKQLTVLLTETPIQPHYL